ncbi:hypothetical protein DSO57_1035953 [Entomophthora muscae]|uniref:Uncharacterized protein n=1 Tax=Entomophthora muscae TaxID=34485 RepID=A0ACC2RQA4_9FUNG|nr:hypothetical protein DSO57_1035953 [Entomophthora muscae]
MPSKGDMFMNRYSIYYALVTALSGVVAYPASDNGNLGLNVELGKVIGKVPIFGPILGPVIDSDFNKNNPPEPPIEIPLISLDDLFGNKPQLSDKELYPEGLEIPDNPDLPINSPATTSS